MSKLPDYLHGGAHFYQRMAQMRTSNPDQSQLMFLTFDLLYRCVDFRGLPGIPSAVLRQMRQSDPLFSYLAGTPKLGDSTNWTSNCSACPGMRCATAE